MVTHRVKFIEKLKTEAKQTIRHDFSVNALFNKCFLCAASQNFTKQTGATAAGSECVSVCVGEIIRRRVTGASTHPSDTHFFILLSSVTLVSTTHECFSTLFSFGGAVTSWALGWPSPGSGRRCSSPEWQRSLATPSS